MLHTANGCTRLGRANHIFRHILTQYYRDLRQAQRHSALCRLVWVCVSYPTEIVCLYPKEQPATEIGNRQLNLNFSQFESKFWSTIILVKPKRFWSIENLQKKIESIFLVPIFSSPDRPVLRWAFKGLLHHRTSPSKDSSINSFNQWRKSFPLQNPQRERENSLIDTDQSESNPFIEVAYFCFLIWREEPTRLFRKSFFASHRWTSYPPAILLWDLLVRSSCAILLWSSPQETAKKAKQKIKSIENSA